MGRSLLFSGYGNYDEEVLVDWARNGDMNACEALMRRYNQRLYRVIRSVLRTDVDVEDTMQDTYVAVLRNLDQLKGRAQFGTWLLKIGTNAALARLRQRMRVVQLDDLPDLDDLEPIGDRRRRRPAHAGAAGVEPRDRSHCRAGDRSTAVRLPPGVHAADDRGARYE